MRHTPLVVALLASGFLALGSVAEEHTWTTRQFGAFPNMMPDLSMNRFQQMMPNLNLANLDEMTTRMYTMLSNPVDLCKRLGQTVKQVAAPAFQQQARSVDGGAQNPLLEGLHFVGQEQVQPRGRRPAARQMMAAAMQTVTNPMQSVAADLASIMTLASSAQMSLASLVPGMAANSLSTLVPNQLVNQYKNSEEMMSRVYELLKDPDRMCERVSNVSQSASDSAMEGASSLMKSASDQAQGLMGAANKQLGAIQSSSGGFLSRLPAWSGFGR